MLGVDSLLLVQRALSEDFGGYGDITSSWTVPAALRGQAVIRARQELVVSGLALAEEVARTLDSPPTGGGGGAGAGGGKRQGAEARP